MERRSVLRIEAEMLGPAGALGLRHAARLSWRKVRQLYAIVARTREQSADQRTDLSRTQNQDRVHRQPPRALSAGPARILRRRRGARHRRESAFAGVACVD